MALEKDLAVDDLAWLADQPHDRQRGDALATAGFADEPEVLTFAQVKIHTVDGSGDAVTRVEIRSQPLDADKIAEEPMEEKDDDEPEEEDTASGRDPFMEELARGASEMAPDIDHRIAEKSAHWKIERMPIVDRNILRLGIYEMSRRETPAAVVIDEALELARQFSGEESVAFINGVLDAVHKEIRN